MKGHTISECIDIAQTHALKAQELAKRGYPKESETLATLSIAFSSLASARIAWQQR